MNPIDFSFLRALRMVGADIEVSVAILSIVRNVSPLSIVIVAQDESLMITR